MSYILGPSGLVGYARDAVLADFEAIGFRAIGDLSVWHRPAVWVGQPERR